MGCVSFLVYQFYELSSHHPSLIPQIYMNFQCQCRPYCFNSKVEVTGYAFCLQSLEQLYYLPRCSFHGSEAFDFVAVEDCGLANVCAMKSDATDENYNVGTGKRTSLKELAELIVEITNCEKPIQYAPRSQATLVRNRIGCPKKATAEIGFTSTIELREGLQKLIDWRATHIAEVEARRKAVGLA